MEPDLEAIYDVFSDYPVNPKMTSSMAWLSEETKQAPLSKRLMELEEEDLSTYLSLSVDSWGDVTDFKHFLPRLLDLFIWKEKWYLLFDKLLEADFRNWPENERSAVLNYFMNKWETSITHLPFDKELFIGVCHLTENLREVLRVWSLDTEHNGAVNFVTLVNEYYYIIAGNGYGFGMEWEMLEEFKTWIKANRGVPEKTFFDYYDSPNTYLLEEISKAQWICENVSL